MLPPTGDITQIKLLRTLREDLSFSEKELKILKFKTDPQNGSVTWEGGTNVKDKEIKIDDIMNGVIVELLKEMSEKKKLTDSHIALWDMFIK